LERAVDVVVAGHLCLDMIPSFQGPAVHTLEEILRPGLLVNVGGMVLATGGTVSNTGIAFRAFGCVVRSIAKVGDDAIGALTLRMLEERGSAAGIRTARGEASSYSVVLVPPGVDRLFLHCTGTNDTFSASDVDPELVRQARLFHFGYPPLMRRMYEDGGTELREVMRVARATGATTSLDMAMPDPAAPSGRVDWRAILAGALPHVDVFLPSIEEAFYCLYPAEYAQRKEGQRGQAVVEQLGLDVYRAVAGEFLAMGCGMVGLKAGPLGWYFRSAGIERIRAMGALTPQDPRGWTGRECWCPAYRVPRIASANGAGDCSIAGFLTAMLRGQDAESCLHLANCAGAHNLGGLDAASGLKGWDAVTADARTLEHADVPVLRGTGWCYSAERGVWEPQKESAAGA
jgi:sugar/nucleoside kinase (ribokinase family)